MAFKGLRHFKMKYTYNLLTLMLISMACIDDFWYEMIALCKTKNLCIVNICHYKPSLLANMCVL